MKVELEDVLLNKGDLKRWIELDAVRYHAIVYYVILITLIDTPSQNRKAEMNASIQAFGDREISFLLEIIFKALLFIIHLFKIENFIKEQGKRSTLVNLLMDVKNHNQVIYRIHVLDELSSVGNQVGLEDRKTVVRALKITKNNLIQALKTNKILRCNPGFKPDRFAVDLASIRSLEVKEKSSEYGQLLNDALQIGVSLQDEINEGLFQKSNSKKAKRENK